MLNKLKMSAITALLTLSAMNSLSAWNACSPCPPQCPQPCVQPCEPCEPCGCNRIYIGGFGGVLYSDSTRIHQMGTAYFPWNDEGGDGPLTVDARGKLKSESSGFGGAQIGYEWTQCPFNFGCADWDLTTAAELEAFWYGHKRKGHLSNQTDTDRLPEHDFRDSFDFDNTAILANAVFTLNSPCLCSFSPYLGLGLGAVHLSISKANSLQVNPLEAGVNHFNTLRNDATWAFAGQVKAGVRYNIYGSLHVFGEYRYLFVDSSKYILGSTLYPNHVHTSEWNIRIKNNSYNAFAFGVQYDL